MAKKRKVGKPYGQSHEAEDLTERPAKLNINTYEDVADSEDEFLLNREKILLEEGPEAKRRRKQREKDEFLQQDEEALAYSEISDSEDDLDEADQDEQDGEDSDGEGRQAGESEEEEEGWGYSKSDYYNTDAIETEQDALDHEAEALRIQKKQLQSMDDADYGFDEAEWAGEGEGADKEEEKGEVITKVLPQLQITDAMGTEERLKLLKSRYPEFERLSNDFIELQPLYSQLSLAASAAQKLSKATRPSKLMVKYHALASYLSSIAMYFALLTSTYSESKATTITAKAPQELRDHPIIDSIVQSRMLWQRVQSLSIEENEVDAIDESDADDTAGADTLDAPPEPMDLAPTVPPKQQREKKKKTKAQLAAEKAAATAAAQRAEHLQKTRADLAALSALSTTKPKKPAATHPRDSDSDLGDEVELTAEELADKARRKRSLKFYTSQITQKANKRDSARRDYGGDMDVPHRERLRDRQERLNREAQNRAKKQPAPGIELGGDSDEEDRKQAREVRGDDNSEDEYYDMVASRNKKRKVEKQERAEAFAIAAREGGRVVEEEIVGPDGKRAIGYTIEKNKGLTPHRKKDVRNPRVKKRKKYDEKKKKLKSMKPVYGGGEGRGGYKGELTGIKTGLVKSTKL